MTNTEVVVLRFGTRRTPRPLAGLPVYDGDDAAGFDAALRAASRVVVVGSDADLAAVLTRLMRTDRLDVEVAHAHGWRSARRARSAVAQRVPLIRDESGTVLVKAALWLPPADGRVVHGEAVVDDEVLFDGEVGGVRIEPTAAMPGLRAAVITGGLGPRRWSTGRAAQLGTTGARMVRDGVPAAREVKRAAFYRHTTGWLRVS
ncbi:peptidase M50 [Mycolicibacterium sp. CBM1]